MKKICFLLLMLAIVGGLTAQDKVLLDKIVARVGGEILLKSDIDQQLALMQSRQADLPPDAECYVVAQLLGQRLLLNQARLDSIVVSEVEVDAQIDARIERILSAMGEDQQRFEEYYGMSIPQARQIFREDLTNQLLTERMQGGIVADVSVTPAEVIAFFNSVPADSLPYFSAEVEIAEIVYEPRANAIEKEKARTQLEDIRRRIMEGGEDFGELAQKYSDDPGSGQLGGDLGWRKRGDFVPEFEAAAYILDQGEVSPVIESPFGYHIVQMLQRRGNRINVRHILITPELTPDDYLLAEQLLDSVQQLIVIDTLQFGTAVRRYSSENIRSYNNGGLMTNPNTGTTFFETSDLEPEVYFAIDTLQVGNVTAPIRFRDRDGKVKYKLIQLRSYNEPHEASMARDYSKIKLATTERKKNAQIDEWIDEKLERTYIQLDDDYRGCPILENWYKRPTSTP